MNSPALDEKVTVVANGHVIQARVCGHQFKGSFQWVGPQPWPRRGSTDGFVEIEDEGGTWIRGWYDENAEPARALLAARALEGMTRIDLEENGRRFVDGEIDEATWRRNVDLWDAQFEEESRE